MAGLRHGFFFSPARVRLTALVNDNIQKLLCRSYARSLFRRPVAVINNELKDDKANKGNNAAVKSDSVKSKPWEATGKPKAAIQKPSFSTYNVQKRDHKFLLSHNIEYGSIGDDEKEFGRLFTSVLSRKGREEKGIMLLEGGNLIDKAFKAGVVIKSIYFTKIDELKEVHSIETVSMYTKLYKVKPKQIQMWLGKSTGVIALCKIPREAQIDNPTATLPITVVCDQIKDPATVGGIIRTAQSVGCSAVILVKGCADVWDPAALRAGAGAHFHVNILNSMEWPVIGSYASENTLVVLADQRTNDQSKGDYKLKVGEIDQLAETTNYDEIPHKKHNGQKKMELFQKLPFPTFSYVNGDYREKEVFLVLGGEESGPSAAACKLAFEREGCKIHIPIATESGSLNSTTAAGIILFEMKRQLLMPEPVDSSDEESEGSDLEQEEFNK